MALTRAARATSSTCRDLHVRHSPSRAARSASGAASAMMMLATVVAVVVPYAVSPKLRSQPMMRNVSPHRVLIYAALLLFALFS